MQVKHLADKLGTTPDTVRYYTRSGFLQPTKNAPNGYNDYSHKDERRLRYALRAKLLGFTQEEIQEITDMAEQGEVPCQKVRWLLQIKMDSMEQPLRESQLLYACIKDALKTWRFMPDGEPDGSYICALIEDWDRTIDDQCFE